ncbi:MAG TPA: DnaJ domain-containing protein [Candidatus Angelobacter sp.]|jgi:curved DNA-binding protein CbpA
MAELPDYYMDLGVDPKAKQQEIEKVYSQRVARLRSSKVEDAPEELAEVEAAYAVLHDPAARARYDAKVRAADTEEDKKYAEMDAYLKSHHHRKRVKGSSGWLDAIWDLLSFFK